MKLLRPLRERDFALLWAGMTISLLGDGIFLVAEAWQVYDLDNDPLALSLVGTAWTLGMVAFLLTGGLISDRADRRQVLILADLVRAAALLGMGVLSITGTIEIWHLVALAALMGIGDAFFGPAFGAIVPDIVSAEHLVQANALQQVVEQAAARLAGPALGGLVVAALGVGPGVPRRRRHVPPERGRRRGDARPLARGRAGRSARAELREGLEFVRQEPWLWSTLISASLSLLFFLGPLEVLLPYVVRNDLHAGAGGFGLVLAAAGVGAIGVSLAVGQLGIPRRYLTFMYAMWTVATLPLAGYAVGTHLWQFVLLGAVYGGCMTGGMVVWGTLMSTRVPPDLRGRVHSLDWFVSIGLTPISFALTGPLSKAIGIDATLILAAILPAVACVVLFVVARLREDEQRFPDAVSEAVAAAG